MGLFLGRIMTNNLFRWVVKEKFYTNTQRVGYLTFGKKSVVPSNTTLKKIGRTSGHKKKKKSVSRDERSFMHSIVLQLGVRVVMDS